MTRHIPADLLRDMVREILLDVVESEVSERAEDRAGGGAASNPREEVPIGDQNDLNRAIRRILADATDPARRAAIERGEVSFVLATAGRAPSVAVAVERVHRVEKGAVTERQVRAAAEAGAVIITAKRVVVTPLAKDKARSLGVVIKRES
jgi:hypothetical protein